jgi:hypothetical protein
MIVVYENRKYFFRDKWLSESGAEVSDILSNFLSEKAMQDGVDPGLFASIVTPVQTRVIKAKPKPKKEKKKSTLEVLFDLNC